jgi:hypothetical protein
MTWQGLCVTSRVGLIAAGLTINVSFFNQQQLFQRLV